MDSTEMAFSILEENRSVADFDGPRDASLVAAAERALGIVFPPSYRAFLLKYGCGDIFGREYYGLTKSSDFENAGIPNAVGVTLSERKIGFPREYLIIGHDGMGGCYVIDLKEQGATNEAPVYRCPSQTIVHGQDCEFIGGSFGDYLYSSLVAAL